MKRTIALAAVALLAASPQVRAATVAGATALPGADQIVTRTLPNGLKLVVWPDRDIPNVANRSLSYRLRVEARARFRRCLCGAVHDMCAVHLFTSGAARRNGGTSSRGSLERRGSCSP